MQSLGRGFVRLRAVRAERRPPDLEYGIPVRASDDDEIASEGCQLPLGLLSDLRADVGDHSIDWLETRLRPNQLVEELVNSCVEHRPSGPVHLSCDVLGIVCDLVAVTEAPVLKELPASSRHGRWHGPIVSIECTTACPPVDASSSLWPC